MKIGNKKISLIQFIRLIVQVISFIFVPALFIQALNGVKQIYLATINQNLNSALLPQMVEIIALIPLTILLGRFFCGWMCGFGAFTDFIYIISGKLFKRTFKVNQKIDGILKYVKYGLLAVLVVFAWSLNMSIFNSLSPWDVFGMTAIVGNVPDFKSVISNLLIAFIFFILIIIASVFVERFFCRYLCPMGAIFAISSKLRIGKIKKPSEKCGKCRICTNNCAMGIPLYETDVVNSAECINCMKCISVCPRHNTSYTIAKKDVQPLIVSAVSVAVMTGSYYSVANAMNLSGSSVDTTQESQSSSTSQIYTNGIYEGTGTGFRGTTKVSVTIKDDKITNITTVSYRDDKQYYDRAFSTISKKIVSSQSADVDTVSGATYSSKGIMQAVTNALSQAKITSQATSSSMLSQNTATDEATTGTATTETTASGSTTSGSTASGSTASGSTASGSTASGSTTSGSTASGSATSGSATSGSTASGSTASGSTTSGSTASGSTASGSTTSGSAASATTAPTTAATSTGKYINGTYQGSGTGFRGTTMVSVVVSDGKITNITTISYKDDKKYYDRAYTTLSKNIVSNQSTNVDTVSGATYSSKGIIQAVDNALIGAQK